jgi:hypothetical protein
MALMYPDVLLSELVWCFKKVIEHSRPDAS